MTRKLFYSITVPIISILVLIFVAAWCLTYRSQGTISGVVHLNGDYWGIESRKFFKTRRLSIDNLPREFQVEGKRVRCDYVVKDVIGTGEWDMYVTVANCIPN